MRFQLLGPLSITDGRDVVVLPPAKPTSLLAALLVRPGEVVPTSRLRQAVWGEEQPATAKAALQSCVLRLRRLFAKYDIEAQAVVAVAGGYLLPADGDTLDLLHFRRLTTEADGAGESELPLLRTALGLWRGPLLTNVPSELLHRDEVPRLVEERLRVLERVCEIQLDQGRCREVLVDLWEATRAHPQHEGLAAQLMRALYRVGRQNEALAEYRRIRTHLRDELGVDPGAELQKLELSILRGDEPMGPALEPTTPALTSRTAPAKSDATADVTTDVTTDATTGDPGPQHGGRTAPAEPRGPGRPSHAESHGPDRLSPPESHRPGRLSPREPHEPGHPSHAESHGPGLPSPPAPHPLGGAHRSARAPGPRLPHVPGFTGRIRETADLVRHLSGGGRPDELTNAAPVSAVISGGPGMGKTALALHAAHLVADRYPAGGVLLSLSGPDGTPRPVDDAAAELRSVLPTGASLGSCLVILDDVVHPDQVRGLLDVTAAGAVVVTSRMGLAALVATHGPAVLQLGALSAQESSALLTTVLGQERVESETTAARTLTDMCGHVPLALRIVGARLLTRPKMSLADYATWLRRDLPARLALPDDPRMSVPLALDQALRRLPAPLADAHLRLARLSGRLTAPAVATTLSVPETDAEELLERLLDNGLLEEDEPGTLRMNALFRAHALHRAATRPGGTPQAVVAAARRALPSGAT
ncbi:BTAD domain-containing putative transcriptional regulator [Streptomyces sp. NPDC056527]|uniref:BTAD domain-containing putative transcriptional regulator n=1 Tax=Streptomyces sp. NPDC056527 TaxID=3345853 RepID=UPI00369FD594